MVNKMVVKLEKPSIKYKESFIEATKESQAEGRNMDIDVKDLENNFEKLLAKFKNYERGKNLPEGYVPETTFWLVNRKDFIGRVSIRHKLNEKLLNAGGHIGYEIRPSKRKMGYGTEILKLALPFAKKLGIDKVLLTCNDNNIGSVKIIEKNGGILENKIQYEGNLKRRYWINNEKN